jgi:hypothetical protein
MEIGENKQKWFNGKEHISFSDMDDTYLQNVFTRCLKKILFYHNRSAIFEEFSEQIEVEAEKRGLVLKDPDTEFHKRDRSIKNKIKAIRNETT